MNEYLKEIEVSFQRPFEAIFRGDAKLDNPFPRQQLVGQKRRQFQEAGCSWIEYQLDVRTDLAARTLTFRVDAQTRLPASLTMALTAEGLTPGKIERREMTYTFDYPERGPADIFALGVPRTAKVVDRVPTGAVAQVMDGIKASRDKFPETYLAIVTECRASIRCRYPRSFVQGTKWRREMRLPVTRTAPRMGRPLRS